MLQHCAIPVASTRHCCEGGLSSVVQHVPLQLICVGRQHRKSFAGGPVMLLGVQDCGGFAVAPVLQQSRLPQHSWFALQQDFVRVSPHTLPAAQQDWDCMQRGAAKHMAQSGQCRQA
jgi:hypothetical protein